MDSDTTGLPSSPGSASDAAAAAKADAGTSPKPGAEPTVLDLSDENALIKVKGSDKPVKFSDHVRGFQAQFTKAAQRAGALEKQLAERDAQLKRYDDEQRAAASRAGDGGDVFAALRALPYLSGEDAVSVVQGIGEQIRQRDVVLLAALKQLQQVQEVVKGLHSTSSSSAFDGKIAKWLQAGGYPPEAADLAKEIYLAYEGDDLDLEFPKMFGERWQQIEKLVEAQRAAKVNAARKAPFLPGRGGEIAPSKPLKIRPDASASEVADELWEAMQEGPKT